MHNEYGVATREAKRASENMKQWNAKLNALITPLPQEALNTASALDKQYANGDWPGSLYGMTVSLKDNIDLAGTHTTAASVLFSSNLAARDATVTSRLKRSGAVIVGKANLHEFAFGPTSQSSHIGPCVNPWDSSRVAGGSSGGSAVAVAAGMCAASIGTDTAGSIRIPASFCGLSGLRPTVGRVPVLGSFPLSPYYDTLGPLAHRVVDVERVFAAIAGFDEDDPSSIDEPAHPLTPYKLTDLSGIRIGVMRRFFFEHIHPDLADRLQTALSLYRELGAQIISIDLGNVESINDSMAACIQLADAYAIHEQLLVEHRASYNGDLLARFDKGSVVTGAQYSNARNQERDWRHTLYKAFRQVDAILTPTTPFPAPRAADVESVNSPIRKEITRCTIAWAFAGVPSLAIPCGYSEHGLPLSMQLTSRWSDEATLFRLGRAFQSCTNHHLLSPDLTSIS